MESLITCVFQLLLGLITLTTVQPISFSIIDGYVNKTGTARLVCSVGTTINDAVVITRNASLAIVCPVPTVCVSQGLSTDYSATQNVSSGITVLTILNAAKDRDGVEWTCRYGSLSAVNDSATLNVASPATSTKLIEEDGSITLEMICTYPTDSLSFVFTLGNVIYSEATPVRTGFQVCTPSHEVSVNYTLTFPRQHSNSYNGTFKVYVNNTLYITMVPGSRVYNFTAEKPNHKENHCPDELHIAGGIGLAIIILGVIIQIVLFIIKGDQCTLGFGICFVIEIIGCIINIVALALKGYQLKLGLGICFGIIMFACIIGIIILVFVKNGDFRRLGHCICFVIIIIICICCIVILAKKGEECQQSFLIGFGIGFGILIIGCIIIILILIFFKKVIIQNKDASPRTNEKEFTITAIVYGLFVSVEWFKEKTLLESNEDFTIEPYDNKTRKSNLIIKSLSMKNSATYICRAKNRCGCCSAEDSITLPHDKDKHQPGSSADVSRNDVDLQVMETGAKSNDKERPPAFHAGTQNKTEPKTASKQTYDIHQPLPSVDRGVEDKPKLRPQPLPPQNSDTKDRNQRGISATIDNPPGLANETPRLNKLPPLTQKQPILQEEGAAEEPKKKRKKKKKKDQTNEGNPEEEVVGFEITSMTIMTKIN